MEVGTERSPLWVMNKPLSLDVKQNRPLTESRIKLLYTPGHRYTLPHPRRKGSRVSVSKGSSRKFLLPALGFQEGAKAGLNLTCQETPLQHDSQKEIKSLYKPYHWKKEKITLYILALKNKQKIIEISRWKTKVLPEKEKNATTAVTDNVWNTDILSKYNRGK